MDKLIISTSISIANTIEDWLRTSDIISRFGDDEFVALLPQRPSSRAKETGERLRNAIENTSFEVDGQSISSKVSIGIATYPDEVGNVFELLKKADEALHECKRTGRNNVTSYSAISNPATVNQLPSRHDKFPARSRKTDRAIDQG